MFDNLDSIKELTSDRSVSRQLSLATACSRLWDLISAKGTGDDYFTACLLLADILTELQSGDRIENLYVARGLLLRVGKNKSQYFQSRQQLALGKWYLAAMAIGSGTVAALHSRSVETVQSKMTHILNQARSGVLPDGMVPLLDAVSFENCLTVGKESFFFEQVNNSVKAIAQALIYLKSSLDLVELNDPLRGGIFQALGDCYVKCGKLEQAIDAYKKAISAFAESGDKVNSALAASVIADAHRSAKRPDHTLIRGTYEKALSDLGELALPSQVGSVYLRYGDYLRKASDKRGAIEKFAKAAEFFGSGGDLIGSINALTAQGETALLVGDITMAKNAYAEAIIVSESLRSKVSNYRARMHLHQTLLRNYFIMVKLSLQVDDSTSAYEYAERTKCPGLLETLSGQIPIDPTIFEKVLDVHMPASKLSLGLEERKEFPPVASLVRKSRALPQCNFVAIRDTLPADTAVVQTLLADSELFFFVFTHDDDKPQVRSVPAGKLRKQLPDYFRVYAKNPDLWDKRINGFINGISQNLNLDKVIELIPPHVKRLNLVPDSFLHYLPFSALKLSNGSRLLDRFPDGLQFLPSAQMPQFLKANRPLDFKSAIIVANPLEDLHWSTHECETIKRFFDRHEIVPGPQATKKAILPLLDSANVLHFSCHGYFHFYTPFASGLVLAESSEIGKDSRIINLSRGGARIDANKCLLCEDLIKMPELSNCSLVTLSACETGLIDTKLASSEQMGMPGAFLIAGAKNVLGSLWKVNDASTAALMSRFYEALTDNPSAALASAQDWLRTASVDDIEDQLDCALPSNREQPFSDPYYWAPFYVTVADWS